MPTARNPDEAAAGAIRNTIAGAAAALSQVRPRRLRPSDASPVAESRRAVAPIDFLAPELVPTSDEVAAALSPELRALCLADVLRPGLGGRAALAALAQARPPAKSAAQDAISFRLDTGQPSDCDTHDAFFRVRRVAEPAPAVFLQSLLLALQRLRTEIEEAPTRLGDEKLGLLAGALARTLATALGSDREPASLTWRRCTGAEHHDHAARRWLRGHQIFAGLSQALIFALDRLERGDMAGDDGMVTGGAALAAQLLAASAVSLELTGDFDAPAYRDVIRVAMETPFLPRGFSGLLSSDHRHLVLRMKRMRPAIERLEQRHPAHHAAIVANLGAVYASHKHVCARFVGTDQSSLLMAQNAERSATAQIDRFKTMRLRSWEIQATEPGR